MMKSNLDDTQPTRVLPTEPSEVETKKPEKKPKRWLWIMGGIIFVIASILVGAGIGYSSAIQSRVRSEKDHTKQEATLQFQLAVEDINAGRYHTAQERLQYVIEIDPSFPGVTEKLTQVLLELATVATPTIEVTPTIAFTPTPDMRGIEEMFNHARDFMRNRDWTNALNTLEAIRQKDIIYRALEVDGMYYICLRFQGMQKISALGNLEGGIYDLALAENFAPIDREADGLRNWARFYLTGASFWEINWQKVIEYFSQIYPTMPNLRDGSGWTAAERFRIASIRYGDQLLAKGDYCGARDQYRAALALSTDNVLAPTATAVQLICSPPTATPTLTPTPTETLTPIPTDAATPTSEPPTP